MPEKHQCFRTINGSTITAYHCDFAGANILQVCAGTNGYKGGDSGHGSRTLFSLRDIAGSDIEITPLYKGVEISLGGDSELLTLIEALKFAVSVLEEQASHE